MLKKSVVPGKTGKVFKKIKPSVVKKVTKIVTPVKVKDAKVNNPIEIENIVKETIDTQLPWDDDKVNEPIVNEPVSKPVSRTISFEEIKQAMRIRPINKPKYMP
jgi:hypothetical protein